MSARFYTQVDAVSDENGFTIALDGRTLKTPGKQTLVLPTQDIAILVAAEWKAQGDKVDPRTMPCTRLSNVAMEQTPNRRNELVKEFQKYLSTDLVSYRAAHPSDLVAKQAAAWDPVLDWAASRGLALVTTTGLRAVDQPALTLKNGENIAGAMDDFGLTLLVHFTASFGSAALALAVIEGFLDIEDAFAASRIDEDHQAMMWGQDEEAKEIIDSVKQDLLQLSKMIETEHG